MLWCEHELGREIVHAGRSKEFRLKEGFRVDGFLPPLDGDDGKGLVFEYMGCWFHACRECFKTQRDRRVVFGRSMDEVYENTQTKIRRMQFFGYEVRIMWECEFERLKKVNPEISHYLTDHPLMIRSVLLPCSGFYGGRTEVIKPMYDIKNNKIVKYFDTCSLYPTI